jgi:hypothetical protein
MVMEREDKLLLIRSPGGLTEVILELWAVESSLDVEIQPV